MPPELIISTVCGLGALAIVGLFIRDYYLARKDDQPDVGLSILERSDRDDATEADLWHFPDALRAANYEPPVYIAPSPLLGARHLSDQYAVHPPTFREGRHRAPLDTPRPAAASPLVHADTAVWDGPVTEEFRRLVDLPVEVPVHREVLREEARPRARWAQTALDVAEAAR